MTTRKKNAGAPRQPRQKPAPPPALIDLQALLTIGEEPVVIDPEENDNVNFMAEVIDPL